MSYGLAQARYASDASETASPARLLTMLYDRLMVSTCPSPTTPCCEARSPWWASGSATPARSCSNCTPPSI